MAHSRNWSAATFAMTLAVMVLIVEGCSSSPDRTERRGSFEIEYRRMDAFGHIATRQTLYHVKGQRRTLVAESGGSFVIPADDPDRVIYYACDSNSGSAAASDSASPCAHIYYDGHTGRRHVIGRGLALAMSQLDDRETGSNRIKSRWARGYVVLGDQYEFVLLDLRTGTSTRLAETLGLESPLYPEKWQHRQGRWGGWSPEGTHAAIIVMSPLGPGQPVLDWQEELHSLEGSTGTLRSIATHVGRLGGVPGNGLWQPRDFNWDGGDPEPRP